MSEPVVLLGGQRTAIGSYGGGLASLSAIDLGIHATKAALESTQTEAADIEHAVFGNIIHSGPRDAYISRVIAVTAGLPTSSPALTVNRLCGSGMQAIISAAQMIMLGDIQTAVAGGAESMSNAGYLMPNLRWGKRMGNAEAFDMMEGALHDPFGHGHMGITAENVAERYHISREMQDQFAVESHRRASHAINEGYFASQISPILVGRKGKEKSIAIDEHVRADASIEGMQKLRCIFKKDGTVTAGNASGINDGAAALILCSESYAQAHNKQPMARILSYAHAGVNPDEMGVGPIPAVTLALKKANLSLSDIDLVESNEAFASQACHVTQSLGFDPAIVNPNGGAVAMGHPVGATGAIITLKLVYELQRRNKRYGVATMCIGGGQGIALVLEAL